MWRGWWSDQWWVGRVGPYAHPLGWGLMGASSGVSQRTETSPTTRVTAMRGRGWRQGNHAVPSGGGPVGVAEGRGGLDPPPPLHDKRRSTQPKDTHTDTDTATEYRAGRRAVQREPLAGEFCVTSVHEVLSVHSIHCVGFMGLGCATSTDCCCGPNLVSLPPIHMGGMHYICCCEVAHNRQGTIHWYWWVGLGAAPLR